MSGAGPADVSTPRTKREGEAEAFLWRALRADDARKRAKLARQGLATTPEELSADTQVLLLRQLYLAHLELHQLAEAIAIARQMVEVGALEDIARHDAARALYATGEIADAIGQQRLAARRAPAARRSFQLWALGTWQHFTGDVDGAIRTLTRARRWASRGKPLLTAHLAYVRLDAGRAVRELDRIVRDLQRSKSREGYGQFLLGMIAWHMGDARRAAPHLRAFLRRNAAVDEPKALTLREELRRARLVLAKIESD